MRVTVLLFVFLLFICLLLHGSQLRTQKGRGKIIFALLRKSFLSVSAPGKRSRSAHEGTGILEVTGQTLGLRKNQKGQLDFKEW